MTQHQTVENSGPQEEPVESDAYLLGTERGELLRLGLQHQVWARHAIEGWDRARFGTGQTILDLGSGPGFCSRDLAYRVGATGKVIAVDISENYLRFLDEVRNLHNLNIEAVHSDFHQLDLPAESVDGVFCRWALAWVDGAREIVRNVTNMVRPGGRLVFQEYQKWGAYRYTPQGPGLETVIRGCRDSFEEMPGNIDVGSELPAWLDEMGLELESVRGMWTVCTPDQLTWKWPQTFLESYVPKLVRLGYITAEEGEEGLDELHRLSASATATVTCPLVCEVIARKAG